MNVKKIIKPIALWYVIGTAATLKGVFSAFDALTKHKPKEFT